MSYQRILLRGNIGSELRYREFPKGDSVCNFSVAVNEAYTDRSGKKHSKATWFQCAAWNEIGKRINQFTKKGDSIFIEGKMTFNKGDDNKIYPQVVVHLVDFIGRIQQNEDSENNNVKTKETCPEEDLPWNIG